MSFLVHLIDGLGHDLSNTTLQDHDFGNGVHPHQVQPHHHLHHQREPTIAQILGLRNMTPHHKPITMVTRTDEMTEGRQLSAVGKDGFQATLDVAQFKPNELTVKVVDNSITVEGKHEEREDDHGYISRHFVRRYTLPEQYDPEKVISTLSSDGFLTISVPNPNDIDDSNPNGRIIQIQQTGPAHLNIKANPQHNESSVNGE